MGTGAALLMLFLLGAPSGARTDWNDYAWPTEAGRIVTSTFGEYRPSHFHAGIDISSGDMSGYAVYASRAGYVSRIRIAPSGYGKILYIRHPDGFTTTYAHLEKFAPAIDARASREQRALGRYPVDIECASGEFPVRKGELVARTGQTGAVSPHLHFEIRDPEGNPVNPFLAPGLRVGDSIPPTITRVAVSPLSPDATVDGEGAARIYRAERVRSDVMRIPRQVVLTGDAGFSLESSDRIPGSRFKNGVYTRELFVDGAPVYEARMDRTPWNEAHEIGLCYEGTLRGGGRGRFARLYVDSPNHLPFYTPEGSRSGIIDCASLAPGPHAFRIVTADFAGNTAEVSGTFVSSRVPSAETSREGTDLSLRLFSPGDVAKITLASRTSAASWIRREVYAPAGGFPSSLRLPLPPGENGVTTVVLENRWGTRSPVIIAARDAPGMPPPPLRLVCDAEEDVVRVRVTAQGSLSSLPGVTVTEGTEKSTVVMTADGPQEFHGWFKPRQEFRGARRVLAESFTLSGRSADSASIDIEPVMPGTSGTITADGGRLLIAYDSLSVLKTLFLRIEKEEGDEGPVYTLSPQDVVLGSGLTVTMSGSRPGGHEGLYSRAGGSWQFIGSRGPGTGPARTGTLHAHLGDVALLADSTAPEVVRVLISPGAGGRPAIIVRFRDDLSGVEYDDLKMYIDGNMVIPEIDGTRRKAVFNTGESLGRGRHELTMRLTDRIGNSGTTSRRFVLP